MASIKILLADDQDLFIEGMRALLADCPGMEIVAQAGNGKLVMEIMQKSTVDLVLMDINMPGMDGIETSRMLKKHFPKVRILILSSYDNREFIADVMHSGADGYILKNIRKQELVTAIGHVAAGGRYVSPRLRNQAQDLIQNISKRELDILTLIAKGFSAPEIARQLFLSVYTVETHRKNIQLKLGLKNQSLLVKYAVERGLI